MGDWFNINWDVDHPELASAHINLREVGLLEDIP